MAGKDERKMADSGAVFKCGIFKNGLRSFSVLFMEWEEGFRLFGTWKQVVWCIYYCLLSYQAILEQCHL